MKKGKPRHHFVCLFILIVHLFPLCVSLMIQFISILFILFFLFFGYGFVLDLWLFLLHMRFVPPTISLMERARNENEKTNKKKCLTEKKKHPTTEKGEKERELFVVITFKHNNNNITKKNIVICNRSCVLSFKTSSPSNKWSTNHISPFSMVILSIRLTSSQTPPLKY